jgi:polyphosphate glucokinase
VVNDQGEVNGVKTLVIDVGGTHVKVLATGHTKRVAIPSGPKMTPAKMVAAVRGATVGWKYDAVSIGILGLWFMVVPSLSLSILGPGGSVLTSKRRSAGQ